MITIDCRSTGQGASTFTINNPGIKITRHGSSKSGNHWLEDIEGKDGTKFAVKDISNSGKHNCFLGVIDAKEADGYRVLQKVEAGIRCLICAPSSA